MAGLDKIDQFEEENNNQPGRVDLKQELLMLADAPANKTFQEQKTMFVNFFKSEEFDADSVDGKGVLGSFARLFKDNIARLEKANLADSKDTVSVVKFLKEGGNFGKMGINNIMAIKNDGKWILTDVNGEVMDVDMGQTTFDDVDFARKNEQGQAVVAVKLNGEWTTINLETKEKTPGRLMKKKAK